MAKTIEQIKKSPTKRLLTWLDKAETQDEYDLIRSVLLYREETSFKMEKANVRGQAEKFVNELPDLQFQILNRPMGVMNEGKFVAHKDEWYWPFHTGTGKPIGKYPCDRDNQKMQNTDLIELGLQIAGGIGAEVTKAEVLKDGASMLVGIKMPERIEVGADVYEQFVYILDNRTGEHGLRIGFGNVCLRCKNQMAFIRKQMNLNFKHTSSLKERLRVLVENIDLARQEQAEQFELLKTLQTVQIDSDIVYEFAKTVTGYDERPEGSKAKVQPAGYAEYAKLMEMIEHEQAQVGMNAYSLLQGVTNVVTHHHDTMYRKQIDFQDHFIYGKGQERIATAVDLLKVFVAN